MGWVTTVAATGGGATAVAGDVDAAGTVTAGSFVGDTVVGDTVVTCAAETIGCL